MRRAMQNMQKEEEQEINITPMLDVVFIMLIFFIVTASFVKESGTEITKPDAPTAVKKPKANILIAIDPNNQVWIDRKRTDPRDLRPNIERLHAQNPQGTVVVQADRKSNYETLLKVLDAARAANVTNVAIAAQK
ncbi:MAG: biopolymer transporter ExbD [Pseudomonadota bacterium]